MDAAKFFTLKMGTTQSNSFIVLLQSGKQLTKIRSRSDGLDCTCPLTPPHIPTRVRRQPEEKHQPPTGQHDAHSGLEIGEAQSFWHDVGSGTQHQIECSQFHTARENGVRGCQAVERTIQFFGYPRIYLAHKRGNHIRRYQHSIEKYDSRLTPSVTSVPTVTCHPCSECQAEGHGHLNGKCKVCRSWSRRK